MTEILLKVA